MLKSKLKDFRMAYNHFPLHFSSKDNYTLWKWYKTQSNNSERMLEEDQLVCDTRRKDLDGSRTSCVSPRESGRPPDLEFPKPQPSN